MIRGKFKLNWFSAEEILAIDNTLPVDDFDTVEPFYDALEELLLDEGFIVPEDEIEFEKETTRGSVTELRYNCVVVRGCKRDKFKVKEIGIRYYGIKNTHMNDLEKLTYIRNHLRPFSVNGEAEEDGVKAQKMVDELIKKMTKQRKKNL